MSDKTEEATPRRLRKAREEGDGAVSPALAQAVGFTVAVALLPALIAATVAEFAALVQRALTAPLALTGSAELAGLVLRLSLPLLGAVALASGAISFAQAGGVLATKKLVPDLNRLNPLIGVKNLFSAERLIAVFRSVCAAAVVSYLALRLIVDHAGDFAGAVGNLEGAFTLGAIVGKKLLYVAAGVSLALGFVDLWAVRRAWLARHRMTRDEVKREFREAEGDPEMKAARRRAHQQALAGATVAAVRDATILIVNPTHLASALRYLEDEDAAPRVVGQGEGELAQKMIEAARAYGVPVVRDVPVAQALRDLEIGDEIPEALYEAVAEILRELWESEPKV